MTDATTTALAAIWQALGGAADLPGGVHVSGTGHLPSVFAVSDLAGAAVGAAALAMAEFVATRHGTMPAVAVDRRLASFWFGTSIRPLGWSMPPTWDAVAGDYPTSDGWIRLHTNAPHHRDAALAVLDAARGRDAVAAAVQRWTGDALEAAIVARGGCAAAMRSASDWSAHPQGSAVAAEPLMHQDAAPAAAPPAWTVPPDRPLHGVRVLDLTRVLAGPVATRFLAGFGAEVLRIDPPWWDEPAVVPDVVLGKRCARLDLRLSADRAVWERLLAGADVLVHGYRADALAGLGLDAAHRRALCPGLVDVSLDAYGWSGPWQGRRGFDSLVQMSSGIAEAGMRLQGRDQPTPLPVQALDHATGYLLAAGVLRGLTGRLQGNAGSNARTSLARMAAFLTAMPPPDSTALAPETGDDRDDFIEATAWGPAQRVLAPCAVAGAAMRWDIPAGTLGTAAAAWGTAG